MNKNKKLISIIFIFICAISLFLLSGCRKKPKVIALILSAPEEQVREDNQFNRPDVYGIFNDASVLKLKENEDYILDETQPKIINGVAGYKNVKKIVARSIQDKTIFSEPFYSVSKQIDNSGIIDFKIPKPLVNVTYRKVNDPKLKIRVKGLPNNPNPFMFITDYGHNYDFDSLTGKYNEFGIEFRVLGQSLSDANIAYNKLLNIGIKNLSKKNNSQNEQIAINKFLKDDTLAPGKITEKKNLIPQFPTYYQTNGLRKNGYLRYRAGYQFKTNEVEYYESNTRENPKLSLSDFVGNSEYNNIEFSHYVYSVGNASDRPVSAKAGNWFDFILVIPVSAIMWVFGFGGSLASAILFTTILVRTLAWPIYAKSNNMSTKMREAQPELMKIQNKYRGMTDLQSKRQMQMETLQVYRKHKIGFSSFLLMFIQMPIFFAMFASVKRVWQPGGFFSDKFTRITNGLGFIDFSQSGLKINGKFNYITFILALLVGATMILLQYFSMRKPKYLKQRPNEEQTEDQKKRNKTTLIIMGVTTLMMVAFSFQSNAVAFYWICGNLFSIAQTLIQNAINEKKYLKKQNKTGLEV